MPPNLLANPSIEDDLSTNLRTFSQQLTDLSLEMTIGSEFFWPKSLSETSDAILPHWPHLTSLNINYTSITPSGHWLFERGPSQPIIEYEQTQDLSLMMEDELLPAPQDLHYNFFHTKASPQLMNEFYLAAGRAAMNMPALRYMELHNNGGLVEHEFEYKASAICASAAWLSTPLFEASDEVLRVWKEVSRMNLGVDLDVHSAGYETRWSRF